MYRIVKDGAELALIEAPSYVRQAGNGCFVLCQEAEAAGIAHNGTVYHLLGREALEGAESVILEKSGRRGSGETDPGHGQGCGRHERGPGTAADAAGNGDFKHRRASVLT